MTGSNLAPMKTCFWEKDGPPPPHPQLPGQQRLSGCSAGDGMHANAQPGSSLNPTCLLCLLTNKQALCTLQMHMSCLEGLLVHSEVTQSHPERRSHICNAMQSWLPKIGLSKGRTFSYIFPLFNIYYPFFSYSNSMSFSTENQFLVPCQSKQFGLSGVMSSVKRLYSLQKFSTCIFSTPIIFTYLL